MQNAIEQWGRLMRAGIEMTRASMRVGETVTAADSVVRSRMDKIGQAAFNPLTGDYAELARMVPEKVEALSQAGEIAATELMALQYEMMRQVQQVGAMIMAGRPMTFGDMTKMAGRTSERATRIAVRSMGVGGAVFAPIHAKATDNARRLASTDQSDGRARILSRMAG